MQDKLWISVVERARLKSICLCGFICTEYYSIFFAVNVLLSHISLWYVKYFSSTSRPCVTCSVEDRRSHQAALWRYIFSDVMRQHLFDIVDSCFRNEEFHTHIGWRGGILHLCRHGFGSLSDNKAEVCCCVLWVTQFHCWHIEICVAMCHLYTQFCSSDKIGLSGTCVCHLQLSVKLWRFTWQDSKNLGCFRRRENGNEPYTCNQLDIFPLWHKVTVLIIVICFSKPETEISQKSKLQHLFMVYVSICVAHIHTTFHKRTYKKNLKILMDTTDPTEAGVSLSFKRSTATTELWKLLSIWWTYACNALKVMCWAQCSGVA